MEVIGISSSQNKNFREEKREFWWWPVSLVAMITWTIIFYQSYDVDVQTKQTGQEIIVKVFDKIPREYKRSKAKIGIMHEHIPIYVIASKRWYRSASIGSYTKLIYSSKHHTYLDPYHKFDVELFFLACMIFMSLIILWRAIWLGLYIWYRD